MKAEPRNKSASHASTPGAFSTHTQSQIDDVLAQMQNATDPETMVKLAEQLQVLATQPAETNDEHTFTASELPDWAIHDEEDQENLDTFFNFDAEGAARSKFSIPRGDSDRGSSASASESALKPAQTTKVSPAPKHAHAKGKKQRRVQPSRHSAATEVAQQAVQETTPQTNQQTTRAQTEEAAQKPTRARVEKTVQKPTRQAAAGAHAAPHFLARIPDPKDRGSVPEQSNQSAQDASRKDKGPANRAVSRTAGDTAKQATYQGVRQESVQMLDQEAAQEAKQGKHETLALRKADFSRFKRIYQSRDGQLALYQDEDGALTAVNTNNFA